MKTVSIRHAKSHLHALAREVEGGETFVVTRRGKPVFDLAPHRRVGRGINWGALEAFERKHRVTSIVSRIADDFDAPLREDFLS